MVLNDEEGRGARLQSMARNWRCITLMILLLLCEETLGHFSQNSDHEEFIKHVRCAIEVHVSRLTGECGNIPEIKAHPLHYSSGLVSMYFQRYIQAMVRYGFQLKLIFSHSSWSPSQS